MKNELVGGITEKEEQLTRKKGKKSSRGKRKSGSKRKKGGCPQRQPEPA